MELLKGYKPAMDRLGEPVKFHKIDVSGFTFKNFVGISYLKTKI